MIDKNDLKERLGKTEGSVELQRLRESEEKYRSLFESMVLGVIYQDNNGQITSMNPAAEEIFGLTIDQMQGRRSTDPRWRSIHEDGSDFPSEKHPAMVALKTGEMVKDVIMGVFDPKNEQTRWININATPQFRKDDKKPFQVYTTFEDITKRKKAEETLTESEEKFSKAFHSNSAAMTVTRLSDGLIINANESFETLFGYTYDETVGHSTNELGIWLTPQERDAEVEELQKRGKLPMHEVTFGTKSGKHIHVLFSVELINIKGQIYILTTSMDITERKKAEQNNQKLLESEQLLTEELQTSNEELQSTTEELQVTNEELHNQGDKLLKINKSLVESEERFRSIIENIQDGYMRIDKAGNMIMVSPSAARMYRFNSIQEMIGTTTHSYFKNSEDRDLAIKKLEKYGKYDNYEVEARRNDGTFFWVSQNAQNYYDDQGNFQGRETIVRDINERKKFEASLRESEERLRLAQTSGNVGIWDWNTITNELNFTPELEQLYGLSPGSIKTYNDWRELTHPDDIEKIEVERDEKIKNHELFDLEFRIFHKSNDIHWLSAKGGGIYDQKGDLTRVLGINMDITERKKTEEKMDTAMDELKRSNIELERFAYVSSHDLQEPLRMVTLYSQLLEKRYKDRLDSDADDFIEYIVEGAQRMRELIDGLLEYSRVKSHAKEFEKVDLEKVLDAVIHNLDLLIDEKNVSISHDSLPVISGDKYQMVQVFQNLISNAIKFQGPNTPEINISVQKDEKEWIIAVKDNGIGIDPKHQKQIFEVFKRLHTKQQYPGTGIGLSITQKIIKHHRGRIWIESELGKGTIFYFTIPNI